MDSPSGLVTLTLMDFCRLGRCWIGVIDVVSGAWYEVLMGVIEDVRC